MSMASAHSREMAHAILCRRAILDRKDRKKSSSSGEDVEMVDVCLRFCCFISTCYLTLSLNAVILLFLCSLLFVQSCIIHSKSHHVCMHSVRT